MAALRHSLCCVAIALSGSAARLESEQVRAAKALTDHSPYRAIFSSPFLSQSMSDPAAETRSINDLLTRFFQAFDEKNWPMLRDCLCDEVFTDYSAFRGVPASTISGDAYVEQRRTALHTLDMQHNFLNLRVELGDAAGTKPAAARCNYIVHRFHPSFDGTNDQYFHSYGHYRFAFANIDGGWKISSIVQHLLRNEGNREIHGAMRVRTDND